MATYYFLKSQGFQKGDEVLLTPITIPDIVNAIHVLGLRPVFVDMDIDTHNIDINDFKNKITENPKVLLLTNLSGLACDLNPVIDLAKEKNLIVVEDNSQAHGTHFNKRLLGTFGDATILSLSIGKTISSLVGGAFLTSNQNISEKFKKELGELKIQNVSCFSFSFSTIYG